MEHFTSDCLIHPDRFSTTSNVLFVRLREFEKLSDKSNISLVKHVQRRRSDISYNFIGQDNVESWPQFRPLKTMSKQTVEQTLTLLLQCCSPVL